MKLGIFGAGAIGCYVGGRLAEAGADVVLVGRPNVVEAIAKDGLVVTDSRASATVRPTVSVEAAALRDCSCVFVCTKSAGSDEAARTIRGVCGPGVAVVSLQNGLRNPDVLRAHLDNVYGGVVGFNVVTETPSRYRRTTTGFIVVQTPKAGDAGAAAGAAALTKAAPAGGFQVDVVDDIAAVQRTKLLMNLNNAVSALTDAPTVQLIFDARYRRILAAVMREALDVYEKAGLSVGKLGPIPARLFPLLLSLPSPLVRLLSRAQLKIDPEARSSMWEDLQRKRKTEIDELNGEIVRLAQQASTSAPKSAAIVRLVKEAEERAAGSPKLSADALWSAISLGVGTSATS